MLGKEKVNKPYPSLKPNFLDLSDFAKDKNSLLHEEFIQSIEPEIKKKYNFVMPALYIRVTDPSLILNEDDLTKFFTSFGEVKFTNINNRHFYILFKFYFSAAFCFNTLTYFIDNGKIPLTVKILENEKEEISKDINISYFELKNLTEPREKLKFNLESQPYISKEQKEDMDNTEYSIKHITIFYINDTHENFKIAKRIIGSSGSNLKRILEECKVVNKVKIRLRGKGSGYNEPNTGKESEDQLQLCISSLDYSLMLNVCGKVEEMIRRLYRDYILFCFMRNINTVYNNVINKVYYTTQTKK